MLRCPLWLALAAFGLLSPFPQSPAHGARKADPDGSVPLPSPGISAERQAALETSPAWSGFSRSHGGWRALWNEATRTPQRAFGPAIPLPRTGSLSPGRIEESARAFLDLHREALGVVPAELRLRHATLAGGIWYVSFVQTLGALDVLNSEVELRIREGTGVMALGVVFYPDLRLSLIPSVTAGAALAEAAAGLPGPAAELHTDGRLWVLPLVEGDRITPHLVWEVSVRSDAPPGNYAAFVDAHDGTLRWRFNRVRTTDVRGRVEGSIQLVLPTDPFEDRPFRDQRVRIGDAVCITGASGLFAANLAVPETLRAMLEGPYVTVHRADGPDAKFVRVAAPGDSVHIRWDSPAAHPAERDAFYHTVLIHRFMKDLDPLFTATSYSMPCAVNINNTCNAYWDGTGINFFRAGNGCPNTAQMADVVYHEYGHGINDRLYHQLGAPWGMINGAVHEGMSDVAAAAILDDPRVGRGFWGPGTVLRNIQNTARYPEDVSSDPHITGLILAGAFWDLRTATSADLFRRLSHFAKYGLPDDPDDGLAFGEWYVETIVADDDDGNLGNGTPHLQAIVQAFEAHGIGSGLVYQLGFSHTPPPSTHDTLSPHTISFSVIGVPLPGGGPDSVLLHYSTDGFQSTVVAAAVSGGAPLFQAVIPPQPAGTLVKYYMSARDPLSGARIRFPRKAPEDCYKFSVGYLETSPGILYAASSTPSAAMLHEVNLESGAASLIGFLGVAAVHGLALHRETGELWGAATGGSCTRLYRISPRFGDALYVSTVPVPNMKAVAFAGGDTLYGATSGGRLYRINLASGDTSCVGTAPGISFAGLAFHPSGNTLWASVQHPLAFRDRIYTVDPATADTTLVGATGGNQVTPSIAFSPRGILYGLKGTGSQPSTLIRISTMNGSGSLVGSLGISGAVALAMRPDSLVTGIPAEIPGLPREPALEHNFPNPFNPSTTIRFRIPSSTRVRLAVYDVLGRQVALPVDGVLQAGTHEVRFDGSSLASGTYFYRLSAGAYSGTGRMILAR
ncbi:MAG: T9SS type A sorting domain-containing protein [Bacteroidota bacterium]